MIRKRVCPDMGGATELGRRLGYSRHRRGGAIRVHEIADGSPGMLMRIVRAAYRRRRRPSDPIVDIIGWEPVAFPQPVEHV